MVALVAIAALMLGTGAGLILLNRTQTGTTWAEWRNADLIGGKWWPLLGIGSFAAMWLGIHGYGLPGPIRAVLLGVLVGLCAPFFLEGLRRWWKTGRGPEHP